MSTFTGLGGAAGFFGSTFGGMAATGGGGGAATVLATAGAVTLGLAAAVGMADGFDTAGGTGVFAIVGWAFADAALDILDTAVFLV